MELTIKTNSPAANVIIALTHPAGSAKFYIDTLSRLFNAVLYNQDDLGMSDTEAIETLRALSLLKADIKAIASDPLLGEKIREYQDAEEEEPEREHCVVSLDLIPDLPDLEVQPENHDRTTDDHSNNNIESEGSATNDTDRADD